MTEKSVIRHISSDAPRVLLVDGSRVVRKLIGRVLEKDLDNVTVLGCETGAEALEMLDDGVVDFVSTALRLPDMDGVELAGKIRELAPQAYMPIVVVSGDVDERLQARTLGDDVTDYFDKSMGFEALSEFIRGYVQPEPAPGGEVLYVEDSRVVALATTRMMKKHGLEPLHVTNVEDAQALLETARVQGRIGADVVLTDVSLKGELTGGDLLREIREDYGYGKARLPVLVMTGDENPVNQANLLKSGANDLVLKPIEERLLITKLLFQMRVSRQVRAQPVDDAGE